jgi:hypothetical protein
LGARHSIDTSHSSEETSPKERIKKSLNLRSTKNKRKSKRPQKKKGQKQLQLWLRQLVPSPSHGDKKENLTTFNSVYKYLKGKEVGKVHVVSTPQMPALLEINPESIKNM